MLVCTACGRELLARQKRFRCRKCGYRFPSEASFCPKCGMARGRRPLRARIGMAFVGLLLLVCPAWIAYRVIATNTIPRLWSWVESSLVPAPTVDAVDVVSAEPSPTPTRPLPPTPLPPTPSSPTSPVTPAATRRAGETPTVGWAYPAPQLAAPVQAAIFSGAGTSILLEWKAVTSTSLAEDEWYMISIAYTGRDGKRVEQTGWSKEPRWPVRNDWWNDASPTARTFQWQVTATRIQGIDPYASPSRTPISPPSTTRSFIWN